jgi:hypothetical protein
MTRDALISLAMLTAGGLAALAAHLIASRRESRRDRQVDTVVDEIMRDPHQDDEDTHLIDTGRRYVDGT